MCGICRCHRIFRLNTWLLSPILVNGASIQARLKSSTEQVPAFNSKIKLKHAAERRDLLSAAPLLPTNVLVRPGERSLTFFTASCCSKSQRQLLIRTLCAAAFFFMKDHSWRCLKCSRLQSLFFFCFFVAARTLNGGSLNSCF